MSRARYGEEEIEKRGQEWYDRKIRALVPPEHQGRICVIDVESGEYEIDDTVLAASRRILAKHPDAALWVLRIGCDAVYSFGGRLEPAKR